VSDDAALGDAYSRDAWHQTAWETRLKDACVMARELVTTLGDARAAGGGLRWHGRSVAEVHELLVAARRESDVVLERGDMVYPAGDEVLEAAMCGVREFLQSNAIYNDQFPALQRFHDDLVAMAAEMFHGSDEAVGTVTTGGTESIMLAMKAARDRARQRMPHVDRPKIVTPRSIHPAFARGAEYLGLELVTTPIGADWTLDVDAYAAAIDDDVVMLAASAPALPTGLVDPIELLAPLALERDIPFHVDACLGGYFLPFAEELGHAARLPDFRVPGVTTISADLHKFGYATVKGTSVLVHRDRSTYEYQPFFAPPMGDDVLYSTSTMFGSRSGAPIAAAWAVTLLLGKNGYLRRTAECLELMETLVSGIEAIDGLDVPVAPAVPLIVITSTGADILSIAYGLQELGWVARPDVQPAPLIRNIWPWGLRPYATTYLVDLRDVVARVERGEITQTAAPTY
jgi:sphinganine-1-phosphate aldolase